MVRRMPEGCGRGRLRDRLVHCSIAVACVCSCDRAADGDAAPAQADAIAPVADAPTDATSTPVAASEPPPRGFAIVRGGAELFAAADGAAIGTLPEVESTTPTDVALAPAPKSGIVVAVVGAQGEHVAVESLVDASRHCARGMGTWADLRVGLFVRKSDLLQVTTREVEHAFADGTRVVVAPGVPIGDAITGAGERVVDGGGLGLELPLPPDAIGHYYEPLARASETAAERVGATLAYGQGRPLGPTTALDHDAHGVFAFERKAAEDGRALVRVGSRCARVWALTDASSVATPAERAGSLYALKAASESGVLGLLGAAADQTSFEIVAGAALTWPDGRAAGLAERAVRTTHAPRRDGTRSCVVVPIQPRRPTGPELCVEASELKAILAEPIGVLGGLAAEGEELAGLGLSGTGGVAPGGGSGIGIGRPSSGSTAKVKPGTAKVHGSLDADIIRRIVRAHLGRIRHCYEVEVILDPSIAGKIVVSFVIDPTGDVRRAMVKSSTLGSARVETCVVEAVERMKFPAPVGGGVVAVTYPLVFSR